MIQIKDILKSKIYNIFVVIFGLTFLIRTVTIVTKPKPYLLQESINKNNVLISNGSDNHENIQVTIKDKNLEKKIRTILGISNKQLTSQDMKKIVSIDLNHNNIESLEGIEYCSNLKNINLTSNKVKSIEPLRNLEKIEFMNLHDNNIQDISALKELVKLKELDLSNNYIENVDSLSDLQNLKKLDLYHNNIADISSLGNLTNLEFVDVSHNKIQSLAQIKNIRAKKILDWGNDATSNR